MQTEDLHYAANALQMKGRLFHPLPEARKQVGIILFPSAFGLGAHAFAQAERFAASGHMVLACDLHGAAHELTNLADVLDYVAALEGRPGALRATALGALSAFESTTGIATHHTAAVGYCLGGTIALELARTGAPIAAAIGLHCSLKAAEPALSGAIRTPVLACLGADDPIISIEERQAFESEMRSAGADWQLHLYGGVVHSFTDPAADSLNQLDVTRYDRRADQRSWESIQSLLVPLG